MKEPVLIGSDAVKKIPVRENNEPIVNFETEFPDLCFDHQRINVQRISKSVFWGRKTIGEMLLLAQSKLPEGWKLLIKECYRPLFVQQGFWDEYVEELKAQFPNWSDQQIDAECSKLVAPTDVAPHVSGAAVDLTLLDPEGNIPNMGTVFNASPQETQNATYTYACHISPEVRHNRQILIEAMESVGFVNYPTEWWHWSYGDKYWAFIKGEPCAIYGIQNFEI